ncbi:MAG: LytTR family DNA-binding domain-containing protein [Desulfitobacterium hafniense]|nr:LytTR family DNA-binding domain-containing protein [Desulfitobacterium hafniense]
MRVIIVDDEAPARDELQFLLREVPGVEVVDVARNGQEALRKITELKPEVVFLDIQMPDMSGLMVARELSLRLEPEKMPVIVFATAFDQHALEAFEVNAIDYILKPFSEERLLAAIERVKRLVSDPDSQQLSRILALLEKPKKTKLPVEENERIILLDPDQIVYCSISDRNVIIKTKDSEYTTGSNLGELEHKLGFLRTHKSYLVNPDMVREVIPWFNGTYNLVMQDSKASNVPVSRTFIKEVRKKLNF